MGHVATSCGIEHRIEQRPPVGAPVNHRNKRILSPSHSAIARAPLPAAQSVGGKIPHLSPALQAAPEDDEPSAHLIIYPIKRRPRIKGSAHLPDAQITRRVIKKCGGRIGGSIQYKRLPHRATDMAGADKMMRPDRRTLKTAPRTRPLPTAVCQYSRWRGGVIIGIAGGIKNDSPKRGN